VVLPSGLHLEDRELYVTCKSEDGEEKLHRVDPVLKMDGTYADKLRLAIMELFGQG
jgi:hypothetical protein